MLTPCGTYPKLIHQRGLVSLFHGDCRHWMAWQPENSMDCMLTDSPYEMGLSDWDRTGISFEVEMWRMALRILKPGAVYINFALPRLYHRLATSVEEAGFEILDMAEWLYAQGKPPHVATRLKPCHEPILVAMKPMSEPTIEANRARWGVGGLWPLNSPVVAASGRERHAANVFLTHADECAGSGPCVGGCPVAELDRQSGTRKSGSMRAGTMRARKAGGTFGPMAGSPMERDIVGDEGGASRFYYVSKVRGDERLGHESEKPEDLIRQIARWSCPPAHPTGPRWKVVDPFVGSGPALVVAEALGHEVVGVELKEEHCAMSLERLARHESRWSRACGGRSR